MAGKQMQLEDWLDDLCVRFIINLPQEDLSSVARLCFQVEEAQWFYEDFIRPLDPTLPSMTLRTFCLRIFQHCPLLASFSVEHHVKAFEEFLQYKTRVPVRGAIMLNQAMDSVVLVKGWKKGANWSFPRGKINKDEDDLDCAVREVYEETGLDLREAGLVPSEGKPKYIEIPMREQHLRLYVFRDVPMDTNFQPRTRKEISKIQWYKLSELPTLRKKGPQNNNHQYDSGPGTNANKFYMVAPFLVPLKKWIISQKKIDEKRVFSAGSQVSAFSQHLPIEEAPTEDEAWAPVASATLHQIESLDGATRELQRLLHMQPPAQPAQSPSTAMENKASALLSLLQPANSAAAAAAQHNPQESQQFPHTPSAFTAPDAGQPRNPHHHTNNMPHGHPDMDQPPPQFTLNVNQASAGWNSSQYQGPSQLEAISPGNQPGFGSPSPHAAHVGPAQPQYAATSANSSYPQALYSQVSRQDYNSGGFQGGHVQASPTINLASGYQSHETQHGYGGQPGQIPAQSHMLPNNQRPIPLTGQSLNLLNVLKKEPTDQQARQPKDIAQAQPSGISPYMQYASSYSQSPSQQVLPSSINNMVNHPPHSMSPMELAGSAVGPPTAGNHRSALLGLFKKQSPEAQSSQSKSALAEQLSGQGRASVGSQAGMELLAQLQNTTSGNKKFNNNVHQSTQPYSNDPGTLTMDRLTIHKQPRQQGVSNTDAATTDSSAKYSKSSTPVTLHPTRILQRGQTLQQLDPAEKSSSPISPHTQSFDISGQNRVGHTNPSPSNLPLPTGVANTKSPNAPNYRTDVSDQQKKQLLSLFGASSDVNAAPHMKSEPSNAGSTTSEALRSHMIAPFPSGADEQGAYRNAAPSRSGSETPISQADQNFLLDYLQSVTNTSRR